MAARLSLMRSAAGSMAATVLFITCWLLSGCSNPAAELNEELRREIILVHDLAMEQTGHLFDLQLLLEEVATESNADRQRAAQLVSALENADRSMFSWMNHYQILAIDDDIEVDNAYRKEQLKAIRMVSRITDQAIVDARQFLATCKGATGN